MCLSSQPVLKLRLDASSKRDRNEWAWVVKFLQQPRLCGMSARARSRVTHRKLLVQFSELVFCFIGMSNLRRPCYGPAREASFTNELWPVIYKPTRNQKFSVRDLASNPTRKLQSSRAKNPPPPLLSP